MNCVIDHIVYKVIELPYFFRPPYKHVEIVDKDIQLGAILLKRDKDNHKSFRDVMVCFYNIDEIKENKEDYFRKPITYDFLVQYSKFKDRFGTITGDLKGTANNYGYVDELLKHYDLDWVLLHELEINYLGLEELNHTSQLLDSKTIKLLMKEPTYTENINSNLDEYFLY